MKKQCDSVGIIENPYDLNQRRKDENARSTFVLDTDHVSLLERAGSLEANRLRTRLERVPVEERATTIISFEEQTRGWISYLAKARSLIQQIEAYRRLKLQLENYCAMLVLDFGQRAASKFHRLSKLRLGGRYNGFENRGHCPG